MSHVRDGGDGEAEEEEEERELHTARGVHVVQERLREVEPRGRRGGRPRCGRGAAERRLARA